MRKLLAGLCALSMTLWPVPIASAAQTPVTGVNTNPTLGAACTYAGIQFKTPDNISWVCADADGDAANEWVVRDLPICNADPPTSPTCTANTQHVCQIVTSGQFKIYGCDGTNYDLVAGGAQQVDMDGDGSLEIALDDTANRGLVDINEDGTLDGYLIYGNSTTGGILYYLDATSVDAPDKVSTSTDFTWDPAIRKLNVENGSVGTVKLTYPSGFYATKEQCTDLDDDGTCEVASDLTNSQFEVNPDDDGTVDYTFCADNTPTNGEFLRYSTSCINYGTALEFVQDEGGTGYATAMINFTGAGVTCTSAGTVSTCNIPGGTGSGGDWANKGIDYDADGVNPALEYDASNTTLYATPDSDGTPNFKWVGGAVPKFYVGSNLTSAYSFFTETAFFGSLGLGVSSYQEQLFLADADGTDNGGYDNPTFASDRIFRFATSSSNTGYEFDIDGSLDIVSINPDGDGTVDYKFCADNGGALGEVLKMGGSNCIAWGSDLGGTPAGGALAVQYTTDGTNLDGESAFIYDESTNLLTVSEINLAPSDPSVAAPGDGVTLYSEETSNRLVRAVWQGIDTGSTAIQPNLASHDAVIWSAGSATTGEYIQTIGCATTNTTGAGVINSPASTTAWTRIGPRAQCSSGTSSGNVCSSRCNSPHFWRGNAAGTGGFYWAAAISSDACAGVVGSSTHCRVMFGLLSSTTSLSGAPNAELHTVYYGKENNQANLQICSNDGSGTATCSDLGANFAYPAAANDGYFAEFYCPQNCSTIYYRIKSIVAGNEAVGTITTDLPGDTTFLTPHLHVQTQAAATSRWQLSFMSVYSLTRRDRP